MNNKTTSIYSNSTSCTNADSGTDPELHSPTDFAHDHTHDVNAQDAEHHVHDTPTYLKIFDTSESNIFNYKIVHEMNDIGTYGFDDHFCFHAHSDTDSDTDHGRLHEQLHRHLTNFSVQNDLPTYRCLFTFDQDIVEGATCIHDSDSRIGMHTHDSFRIPKYQRHAEQMPSHRYNDMLLQYTHESLDIDNFDASPVIYNGDDCHCIDI
mgnify:CR=1 FL=1